MKRRSAFTLVELLVVIGIIALLVSILLPALGKARQQANLVACMAQMKEIGNAMAMYENEYKGSFPGPMYGQVRVAYQTFANHTTNEQLADYLWKYLRLPAPREDGSYTLAKVFFCPGYRANNPGTYDENFVNTYHVIWYDPWIWTGYPSAGASPNTSNPPASASFPMYDSQIHKYIRDGDGVHTAIPPMKVSQVWEPQRMVILSDVDNALFIYENGVTSLASYLATSDTVRAQAPFTSHGGRSETRQGVSELGGGPFWNYTDKTAHTDPPRNQLFVDGHVETVRKSDRLLPPQFLKRYGPKPPGWFAFTAVMN